MDSLPTTSLLHRRWFQNLSLVFIGIIVVYAAVYVDLVFRARHAFLEGEKYSTWDQNPSLKQQFLQEAYEKKKISLDRKRKDKKLNDGDYESELQTLKFDLEYQMKESSLKYAYAWYKDAYELFSPPESKWVKMAREKAPQTLELWKKELREKKIPFEESMVQ